MRIRRALGRGDADSPGWDLLDSSSVIAFVEVSAEGLVTRANERLLSLLGHDTGRGLLGRPLIDLVADREDWDNWQASAMAGLERGIKVAFHAPSGEDVVLAGDLVPARDRRDGSLMGIFVDVTEKEQLRAAAQRAARMEALGSMTGGIAHDLNNHLTVLVGNLYLAAEDHRADPATFQKLKAARDAAKRGADLIRQLLAFARREAFETEIVDPARVIEDFAPLLRRAVGARIKLETRMQPEAGNVRCNVAQLESAIVNLGVNARDAIAVNGRILLSVEAAQVGDEEAERRGLRSGAYVRIGVVDDGCGVPPETLPRIFEPFFTTKRGKGGTGLGLTMVRWFAQQAGGGVLVDSVLGKGTAVSLFLPRTEDRSVETASTTSPLSTLRGGEEHVLVLATDENVQWTVRQVLETLGYGVTVADNAEEVLLRTRARSADMLLVDAAAQYPAERKRLLAAVRAACPDIKVVLAVDAADAQKMKRAGAGDALLSKPFSIAELADVLRRTFDG